MSPIQTRAAANRVSGGFLEAATLPHIEPPQDITSPPLSELARTPAAASDVFNLLRGPAAA